MSDYKLEDETSSVDTLGTKRPQTSNIKGYVDARMQPVAELKSIITDKLQQNININTTA